MKNLEISTQPMRPRFWRLGAWLAGIILLIGLALFLMGWLILPFIYAKRSEDWLSVVIILTFAIAWITEIYFDRSLGGMLTGFFIPFLLTDK